VTEKDGKNYLLKKIEINLKPEFYFTEYLQKEHSQFYL